MEAYYTAVDRALENIKYSPLMNSVYDRGISIADDIISSIHTWVDQLIESILRFFFGTSGSVLASDPSLDLVNLMRAIFWVILGVALLVVFFSISKYRRRSRQKINALEIEEAFLLLEDQQLTVDNLLQYSNESHRKSDYRKAIRYRYIALLWNLNQESNIDIHPSDTNWLILNKLRRTHVTMIGDIENIFSLYELTWFGNKIITGDEWTDWLAIFNSIIKVVNGDT